MRWAIGIMLVINLAVFLWGNFRPAQQVGKTEIATPDVGNLRLMSERELQPASVAKTSVAKAESAPITPEMEQRTPATNASAVVKVAEEPKRMEAVPLPEKTEAVLPPSETLATPPKPVVSQPESITVAKPEPAPVVDDKKAEKTFRCWQVGAYERRDNALLSAKRLPDGFEFIRIGEGKKPMPIGYYVMVPPANSKAEAKATVAKLHRSGIKDTWIFPKGKFKNAISLGLFSREPGAKTLAKRVQKKGFEAVVRNKTKQVQRYWIEVRAPDRPVYERLAKRVAPVAPVDMSCP